MSSNQDNLTLDQAQRLLEKDVQMHLASNLHLLGIDSLTLVGTEYQTKVGRIDILAKLPGEELLAIELKRGTVVEQDVGQLLKYVGVLKMEQPELDVFGLLVGPEITLAAEAALVGAGNALRFCAFKVAFEYAWHGVGISGSTWPPRKTSAVPKSPSPGWASAPETPPSRGSGRAFNAYCRRCATNTFSRQTQSGARICGLCGNSL